MLMRSIKTQWIVVLSSRIGLVLSSRELVTAANQVGGKKGPNSQLGISAYTQISLHLKSFFDLEPPSPTPFSQDHIPQHHLSSRNLSRGTKCQGIDPRHPSGFTYSTRGLDRPHFDCDYDDLPHAPPSVIDKCAPKIMGLLWILNLESQL